MLARFKIEVQFGEANFCAAASSNHHMSPHHHPRLAHKISAGRGCGLWQRRSVCTWEVAHVGVVSDTA